MWRIAQLTKLITQEKNRLHADGASRAGEAAADIKAHLRFLGQHQASLRDKAEKLIKADPELKAKYAALITVKGIARVSAIALLGELAVLAPDMDKRQWTALAGLDPRPFDSGSSVHKPARIGKAGNAYLKRALYMPALVASKHEPAVAAFYQHLTSAGKKPIQAVVAVMRKLLCAIWGMFSSNTAFDGSKFYPALCAVGV